MSASAAAQTSTVATIAPAITRIAVTEHAAKVINYYCVQSEADRWPAAHQIWQEQIDAGARVRWLTRPSTYRVTCSDAHAALQVLAIVVWCQEASIEDCERRRIRAAGYGPKQIDIDEIAHLRQAVAAAVSV